MGITCISLINPPNRNAEKEEVCKPCEEGLYCPDEGQERSSSSDRCGEGTQGYWHRDTWGRGDFLTLKS